MRRSWIALLAAATGLGLLAGPAAADEPVPPSADRVVTDYQDPVQALPPVSRPPTRSCAVTAMRHTFANSYGRPYVGTLTPPPDCPGPWSKVVLDWTGRSRGRQYDRLAGLWIGGAEVLRTSTPEPDPSGITWHFDRDITPFAPLLREPQPLVVDLGNIVNDTYTGAYDIEVTITYYGVDERHPAPSQADVVVPLSADPRQPGWRAVTAGQTHATQVVVPANTARLTADVYARGGGCEEFWWSNVPTELARAHPDAGLCGGGTYREVTVRVDGRPAGVVAPYPVIYTGGVAPMLWRPISAVDAIVTLPYRVDLTPFVGLMTDGRPHTVELVPPVGIVDAWTLGGTLFATTDPAVRRVTGEPRVVDVPDAAPVTRSTGDGLDVRVTTHAERRWRTEGVVRTSAGEVTVSASGEWTFDNTTELRDAARKQTTRHRVSGAAEERERGRQGPPSVRRDGFEHALDVESTTHQTDANNYRIDGRVQLGRVMRTSVGRERPTRTVAFSDDRMTTAGGFGRTDGALTYADGSSTQRWRGLDDAGRCRDHTLGTRHGWVVSEILRTADCQGRWRE
ncbi:peptide-N4-asparagine amidase [Streptoalloteichus tenebrarius]|uniref:peptide-N4-asparagine amidase n=1 Tax=Streptoalloteichus tenebrarius (strain ATCC 17920 / DSM 40477 / JCM 4838 / CBS 697.72 / NBRC 16177 / NCIMB 11028 / NRRL B-12390 / A12253. 1 / ISP 5477) TaxID=1933 RepID=UPI0020A3EED2|nr:peptide-N4-asparagine amidase [Streptoalloteichus tenebrarius]